MKLYIKLIFCLLFCFKIGNAQTDKKKSNALSLELGKTGLIFNLAVDHRFLSKNFGVRIDVGSNFNEYLNAFLTGGGGYYLFGHYKKFFELGIDINYLKIVREDTDVWIAVPLYPDYAIKTYYASMNIGYRRYGKGSLLRIGMSPGIIKDDFVPGGYISYGFTF